MAVIRLPSGKSGLLPYELGAARKLPQRASGPFNRVALAAAHVVADPLADGDPWLDTKLDWDATLAYRRHLWGLGLGVAEAMDTAQRGMGLDWPTSLELIRRSVDAASDIPGALLFSGAGTDQLAPGSHRIDAVAAAYEEQAASIEGAGGRLILMASRALAAAARGPEDYARIYGRILGQVKDKVILHWLGDMFDPDLSGYWGDADLDRASAVALDIIAANAARIDGVKISLLDKDREIALRRRLPPGVRMYTGDDFNYPQLILGDEHGASDALLGIFDAIAPAAAAALVALDRGDVADYERIFTPTVALSRHIFGPPTRFYKTGVVFLAYLNGHQAHFHMVGGQESARSILHLADVFRLADHAQLLVDPELAVARMKLVLALAGL